MSSNPEGLSETPIPPHSEPESVNLPAPNATSDVKFTRAGALWSSLILGFLILIVLLIFIAQNTAPTQFTFLSWHWNLPLGVAILLAAVCGGLITALVSAARIFQLRRAAKKNLVAALKR
jgi:uncharacterized integral membrane protein